MARFNLECPHCKRTVYDRDDGWLYKLDTPLKTCQYCGGEYLFPYTIEWNIAGPFYQFFYTFIVNVHCGPALFMIGELMNRKWILALIFGLIWIGFGLLRLRIFDFDLIKESYQRTKNNPEYIQKLSDMGYMYIDMRIDPFYKN